MIIDNIDDHPKGYTLDDHFARTFLRPVGCFSGNEDMEVKPMLPFILRKRPIFQVHLDIAEDMFIPNLHNFEELEEENVPFSGDVDFEYIDGDVVEDNKIVILDLFNNKEKDELCGKRPREEDDIKGTAGVKKFRK
jgi:hypothetical protein